MTPEERTAKERERERRRHLSPKRQAWLAAQRQDPAARERKAAAFREWQAKNAETHRAARRAYREANRARLAAEHQAYKEAHRAAFVAYQQTRMRRIHAAGRMEPDVAADVLSATACYYCHEIQKLTIDHVVPVSQGGGHDRENLVAACRSCNSRKKTMPFVAFLASFL